MDVLLPQTPPASSLNPNAPPFIPMSFYDVVEDFSNEWWSLVHSSPWFRDYWLRDSFQDPQSEDEDLLLFADLDDLISKQEDEDERRSGRELVTGSAWRKTRGKGEAPKYGERAPKIVNVKVSPRPIQQPR